MQTTAGYLRATVQWRWSESGWRERGYFVSPRTMPWAFAEVADAGRWLIEGDGWAIHSQPGQVAVVPAHVRHRMTQTGPGATSSRWWAVSLVDALGRDVLAVPSAGWLLSEIASREIRELLDTAPAGPERTVLDTLETQKRAMSIVGLVLAACPDPPVPGDPVDPRIRRVLEHIDAHLDGPLPRAELAAIAHLSATRFSDVFTAALGLAPGGYVIRQRMQRAQELLLSTDSTVARIAAACGYGDASQFSRDFHRRVGRPPGRYRRLFGGR